MSHEAPRRTHKYAVLGVALARRRRRQRRVRSGRRREELSRTPCDQAVNGAVASVLGGKLWARSLEALRETHKDAWCRASSCRRQVRSDAVCPCRVSVQGVAPGTLRGRRQKELSSTSRDRVVSGIRVTV
jgi:hypothetical protein